MSQTNGKIERKIRLGEDGVRTILHRSGVPVRLWPLAGQYFCTAMNVTVLNGNSAWNNRHKKGHFGGELIPFGARVDFLPPKHVRKNEMPKFAATAVPGIFLGWMIQPGGHWSKDYLCAMLQELDGIFDSPAGECRKIRVYRIREVHYDPKATPQFPLKEAAERAAGTLRAPPGQLKPVIVDDDGAPDEAPPEPVSSLPHEGAEAAPKPADEQLAPAHAGTLMPDHEIVITPDHWEYVPTMSGWRPVQRKKFNEVETQRPPWNPSLLLERMG